MDRLAMPAAMPAELAERLSDVRGPIVSDDDRKQAREELIGELLDGKNVNGPAHSLSAFIEHALQTNYAWTLAELRDHFAGIGELDEITRYDRCSYAGAWMRRLCEADLEANPDIIEERAAQIAQQSLEDA